MTNLVSSQRRLLFQSTVQLLCGAQVALIMICITGGVSKLRNVVERAEQTGCCRNIVFTTFLLQSWTRGGSEVDAARAWYVKWVLATR
jgi:hypothetical protein